MKYYSFLNESTRTVLKHAKDLTSKKGQLMLKKARNQMESGKEVSKNLAKLNQKSAGCRTPIFDLSDHKVQEAAENAAKKGFKAKHGKDTYVRVYRDNGKHKISFTS